ncbi:MAG: asparagine synthase (glutamine-hydrolyzing) [Phycisphaerae bacterium]|nr:asparagine synthase (glutamine-hydrolyzing) [Phycisphaerae bacterium]
MVLSAGGVDCAVLTQMRDTLSHRGPDDAGLWISPDGGAGLAHRRLSILDLSEKGRQPMADDLGRAVIVYNGEVYNFADLRRELQAGGAVFHSDTDTEVVLQAYLAWGETFVDHLEGMFAIALWDVPNRKLLLVRDRLGIKPLFYALDGGGIIFGSEIRAVLASECISRDLSPEAAWDFFSYGYVPTPATIYRKVFKLPPATMLRYQAGEVELANYWAPQFECLGDSPETAAGKLREHIDRAVEDYLVADVPTGAYLSGGVDSSIVTQRAAAIFREQASTHRLGGANLHTFTIGFDVEEHSEAPQARAAAERFGTEHTELIVSREMAHEHDETILDLFDEPFAASSTIPMTFLAALARRKATVALCGEGGDETFGGYSWYRSWLEFQKPSFWKSPFGKSACKMFETLFGRRKKKWRLAALESVELYAQLMGAVTGQDKRRIFSAELAEHMQHRDNAAYFRQHWRDDLPPMARMQYVDLCTFLPDLNLTRADRTSMRVGLELRVPLLNHRLVEYVIGLQQSVRNGGDELKGLFKRTVEDRLPEDIRTRKKKGFSAPVKQWFTPADLRKLLADVRAEKPDLARAWLAGDLEKHAAVLTGSRGYKLWVFLQWLRKNG